MKKIVCNHEWHQLTITYKGTSNTYFGKEIVFYCMKCLKLNFIKKSEIKNV